MKRGISLCLALSLLAISCEENDASVSDTQDVVHSSSSGDGWEHIFLRSDQGKEIKLDYQLQSDGRGLDYAKPLYFNVSGGISATDKIRVVLTNSCSNPASQWDFATFAIDLKAQENHFSGLFSDGFTYFGNTLTSHHPQSEEPHVRHGGGYGSGNCRQTVSVVVSGVWQKFYGEGSASIQMSSR